MAALTLTKTLRVVRKAVCLATAIFCAADCSDDTGVGRLIDRLGLLTEYHFQQDARAYANHSNGGLRETYLISALTEFEAMAVSLDSAFHLGLLYSNYLGMGRQNEAILFDPRDVHYAIAPFFEYRRGAVFFQAGLDHRCFHEVDRRTRAVSPYWNQAYVRASSANYRFKLMKKNYIDAGRDGVFDNLKWQAWAGYFVRKFGGMDSTLLSGGHPWAVAAGAEAGYSFYRSRSWIFSGRNKIAMFSDTAGTTPYWAGELGIDADVHNRQYAVGFFVSYNYEFPQTQPLFSKDRLVELGLRFRF